MNFVDLAQYIHLTYLIVSLNIIQLNVSKLNNDSRRLSWKQINTIKKIFSFNSIVNESKNLYQKPISYNCW